MKKYTVFILLVFLSALSFARSNDTTHVHWKITTKPTELLLGNIPLTVEKVYKRRTLGLTLAYRPSYQSSGNVSSAGSGLAGDYEYQYAMNKIVQGAYVGINSKNYIFGAHRKFYIDPELFFRRWWCNNKNESFSNVEGYHFNATRTESINVYGLKILMGYSFVFCKTKAHKIVMDTYFGTGLRYKTWNYESTNGTVNGVYYTNKTDSGNSFLPSVHLGVQFGVGF